MYTLYLLITMADFFEKKTEQLPLPPTIDDFMKEMYDSFLRTDKQILNVGDGTQSTNDLLYTIANDILKKITLHITYKYTIQVGYKNGTPVFSVSVTKSTAQSSEPRSDSEPNPGVFSTQNFSVTIDSAGTNHEEVLRYILNFPKKDGSPILHINKPEKEIVSMLATKSDEKQENVSVSGLEETKETDPDSEEAPKNKPKDETVPFGDYLLNIIHNKKTFQIDVVYVKSDTTANIQEIKLIAGDDSSS
jgi:hypothetical protein